MSARWPVEILNILPVPLLPYKEVQLGLPENVMVAPKYLSLTMSGQLHIFFSNVVPSSHNAKLRGPTESVVSTPKEK